MTQSIEFTCSENDMPIEVQLEPEGFIFEVEPNNTIRFEALNPRNNFKWTLRIQHEEKGIQLFPDGINSYDGINIYLNEQLRKDWSDLVNN